MSDSLERAIDEMADELAAMGKAMSRDSKRIEKLEAENERLREAMNCCEAIAFDFSDDEIKSEAPSVRGAWKIGNESLRNQGPAEGGAE